MDDDTNELIGNHIDKPIDGTTTAGTRRSDDISGVRVNGKRLRVAYLKDAARRARFVSLANAFLTQLCNFSLRWADGLHVVRSIIWKPKL